MFPKGDPRKMVGVILAKSQDGDELLIDYELSLKSSGQVLDKREGMDFRTDRSVQKRGTVNCQAPGLSAGFYLLG